MNTSSAQTNCSDILNDTITITAPTGYFYSDGVSSVYNTTGGYCTDTITISGAGSGYTIGGAGSTITFTGTSSNGFTAQDITSLDPSIFNWKNEEFVDTMPELSRIKKMCDEYPGLKIAYEKFVTTYRLVKDDYDNPNKEKP